MSRLIGDASPIYRKGVFGLAEMLAERRATSERLCCVDAFNAEHEGSDVTSAIACIRSTSVFIKSGRGALIKDRRKARNARPVAPATTNELFYICETRLRDDRRRIEIPISALAVSKLMTGSLLDLISSRTRKTLRRSFGKSERLSINRKSFVQA
jgi:hypothetical protein